MTMTNGNCDVCRRPGAVGVASTVMPYSCAYCVPCLQANAQPDIVFVCMYDDFGLDYDKISPAYLDLVTWKDGKYVDYRTWSKDYKPPDKDDKPPDVV